MLTSFVLLLLEWRNWNGTERGRSLRVPVDVCRTHLVGKLEWKASCVCELSYK